MKQTKDIKIFLEDVYEKYHKPEFIKTDPIIHPYNAIKQNKCFEEVEFIAFISAMFSYGNVTAIQKFLQNYFQICGHNPTQIPTELPDSIYYRFQKKEDIELLNLCIKDTYNRYGSLKNFFTYLYNGDIIKMQTDFNKHFKQINPNSRGLKMLFADPIKSGAKRLNMFLRWMVRKDSIDFGLYNDLLSPNQLTIPTDIHILQFSSYINLISKQTSNAKNAVIISDFFKSLNPEDPLKYDFSLTRLGIVNGCNFSKSKICKNCIVKGKCYNILL